MGIDRILLPVPRPGCRGTFRDGRPGESGVGLKTSDVRGWVRVRSRSHATWQNEIHQLTNAENFSPSRPQNDRSRRGEPCVVKAVIASGREWWSQLLIKQGRVTIRLAPQTKVQLTGERRLDLLSLLKPDAASEEEGFCSLSQIVVPFPSRGHRQQLRDQIIFPCRGTSK